MIRGTTEAETCALNGWTVGTQLVGDEGYGPTIIRLTAIGERQVLAVCVSHGDGKPCQVGPRESSWTLTCRDWEEWKPQSAEDFVDSLRERLAGPRGGKEPMNDDHL